MDLGPLPGKDFEYRPGFLTGLGAMISIIGATGILAALLFLLSCLVAGTLLGGSEYPIRSVLALGTAQGNLAAAKANFSQNPAVIMMILVLGLVDLSVLLYTASLMGRRNFDPQPAG